MIDVVRSVDLVFAIPNPRSREYLQRALVAGSVRFPATALQLPPGVSLATIDGYRCDLARYDSDGILRLKRRLVAAEDRKNWSAANTLRREIGDAPGLYEAAAEGLTAALDLRQRREQALARWLRCSGLELSQINGLARCLRCNVTYLHYRDLVLYVEFD